MNFCSVLARVQEILNQKMQTDRGEVKILTRDLRELYEQFIDADNRYRTLFESSKNNDDLSNFNFSDEEVLEICGALSDAEDVVFYNKNPGEKLTMLGDIRRKFEMIVKHRKARNERVQAISLAKIPSQKTSNEHACLAVVVASEGYGCNSSGGDFSYSDGGSCGGGGGE